MKLAKTTIFVLLLIVCLPFAAAQRVYNYDIPDVSEACEEKHEEASNFADILDNDLIQALEVLAASAYTVCTVMNTITRVMNLIAEVVGMFTPEAGCCAKQVLANIGVAACVEMATIYDSYKWDVPPAMKQLCGFVSCGWCTGAGVGEIGGVELDKFTLGAIPQTIQGQGTGLGQFGIGPYDNIYTAIGCACPIAVLYNLRKLKNIYETYDCCVQQSCQAGQSTEECDHFLSTATCMYWEGSILKSLVNVLLSYVANAIKGIIPETLLQSWQFNCALVILDLWQAQDIIDNVQDALGWLTDSFNDPVCEDIELEEVEEKAGQATSAMVMYGNKGKKIDALLGVVPFEWNEEVQAHTIGEAESRPGAIAYYLTRGSGIQATPYLKLDHNQALQWEEEYKAIETKYTSEPDKEKRQLAAMKEFMEGKVRAGEVNPLQLYSITEGLLSMAGISAPVLQKGGNYYIPGKVLAQQLQDQAISLEEGKQELQKTARPIYDILRTDTITSLQNNPDKQKQYAELLQRMQKNDGDFGTALDMYEYLEKEDPATFLISTAKLKAGALLAGKEFDKVFDDATQAYVGIESTLQNLRLIQQKAEQGIIGPETIQTLLHRQGELESIANRFNDIRKRTIDADAGIVNIQNQIPEYQKQREAAFEALTEEAKKVFGEDNVGDTEWGETLLTDQQKEQMKDNEVYKKFLASEEKIKDAEKQIKELEKSKESIQEDQLLLLQDVEARITEFARSEFLDAKTFYDDGKAFQVQKIGEKYSIVELDENGNPKEETRKEIQNPDIQRAEDLGKRIATLRAAQYEITFQLLQLTLGKLANEWIQNKCEEDWDASDSDYNTNVNVNPSLDPPPVTSTTRETGICLHIDDHSFTLQAERRANIYEYSWSIGNCKASMSYQIIFRGPGTERVAKQNTVSSGVYASGKEQIRDASTYTHVCFIHTKEGATGSQCFPVSQ